MLKNEVILQNIFFFAVFFLERYFLNAIQNISNMLNVMPMKLSGLLVGIKNCDID